MEIDWFEDMDIVDEFFKYTDKIMSKEFPKCILGYDIDNLGFEILGGDINTYQIRHFAETNPLADCFIAVQGQGKQCEFTHKLSECVVVPRKIVLAEKYRNKESIQDLITLIKLCYPEI